MRFLSREWVDALNGALVAAQDLRDATRDIELVIQQEIDDAPDGEAVFHLSFGEGGVQARYGRHPQPDIRFSEDYDTAVRIATGELSAQAAFMHQRLRVGGDVALLMDSQWALTQIGDLFVGLRETTEY